MSAIWLLKLCGIIFILFTEHWIQWSAKKLYHYVSVIWFIDNSYGVILIFFFSRPLFRSWHQESCAISCRDANAGPGSQTEEEPTQAKTPKRSVLYSENVASFKYLIRGYMYMYISSKLCVI